MPTNIFPGNFQPFHNGHLLVVQGMMKIDGNATIVICEHQHPDPEVDLFSTQSRREMISAALLNVDITDANIVAVKDDPNNESWARYVLDAAGNPPDALVWSGHADVRAIFEAIGVPTKKIVPVPGIESATIRQSLRDGTELWESKVPSGAAELCRALT